MQVLPPGTPLKSPNLCTLCEQWPNPDSGEIVIDTLRDFEVGVITRLSGRKYICYGCAADIAETVGFVSGAVYHESIKELEERTLRINRLEAVSTALGEARELQATLSRLLPDIDSIAQDEADEEYEECPGSGQPPVEGSIEYEEAVDVPVPAKTKRS